MNIFILDQDPVLAGRALCDKHIVKMAVETAQILCTAAHMNGCTSTPYRPTHINHPCTLWANETRDNWDWTILHGKEICEEYTRRFWGDHKSRLVIEWCEYSIFSPTAGSLTPFVLAMPEKYKGVDAVQSYRDYYKGEKKAIAKWRGGNTPSWW